MVNGYIALFVVIGVLGILFGGDPDLMDAIIQWIGQTGCVTD